MTDSECSSDTDDLFVAQPPALQLGLKAVILSNEKLHSAKMASIVYTKGMEGIREYNEK